MKATIRMQFIQEEIDGSALSGCCNGNHDGLKQRPEQWRFARNYHASGVIIL